MKNPEEYKAYFHRKSNTGKIPVLDYIEKLSKKNKSKVLAYIDFLITNKGKLDEPFSRYIKSGIRELRVDFSHNKHRIFYITVIGKKIIFLHAFLKKTKKTPKQEIERAINNFEDFKLNKNIVGYEKNKK